MELRAKLQTLLVLKQLTAAQHGDQRVTLADGRQLPRELVEVGDEILVKPGASVPVDGTLLGTEPVSVDESLLTGESKGILKNPGDTLYTEVARKKRPCFRPQM